MKKLINIFSHVEHGKRRLLISPVLKAFFIGLVFLLLLILVDCLKLNAQIQQDKYYHAGAGTPFPLNANALKNNTALTNYASIPNEWKGL